MGARVNGEIRTKGKKTTTREGASNALRWGIGVSVETKPWRVAHGGLVVGMMCVIGRQSGG